MRQLFDRHCKYTPFSWYAQMFFRFCLFNVLVIFNDGCFSDLYPWGSCLIGIANILLFLDMHKCFFVFVWLMSIIHGNQSLCQGCLSRISELLSLEAFALAGCIGTVNLPRVPLRSAQGQELTVHGLSLAFPFRPATSVRPAPWTLVDHNWIKVKLLSCSYSSCWEEGASLG